MAKATEVIGRRVVVREGGHRVGKIKDIVVDPSGRQVLGFVISEGLLAGTKVAPWVGLQAIGPDSVVLGAVDSVVKASEVPDINDVLKKDLSIRGLNLQTTKGKDLGEIDDLEFDESTGAVLGYELSGGMLSDTFGGRSFLPTPSAIELGKDVAFVEPEVEATIRQSSGGIRGAFRHDSD